MRIGCDVIIEPSPRWCWSCGICGCGLCVFGGRGELFGGLGMDGPFRKVWNLWMSFSSCRWWRCRVLVTYKQSFGIGRMIYLPFANWRLSTNNYSIPLDINLRIQITGICLSVPGTWYVFRDNFFFYWKSMYSPESNRLQLLISKRFFCLFAMLIE